MIKLRPASYSDIPELKKLWTEIFGDEEDFLSLFFTELFPHCRAFAAFDGNKLIGSAYVLEICSLADRFEAPVPCSYIYAVGVRQEYRGLSIGKALTAACREYCEEAGGFSCLVPADEGLFSFYERFSGYIPAFYIYEDSVASSEAENAEAVRITAEEYLSFREELLSPLPHLRFSSESAVFLEKLFTLSDGGLYRLSFDGCICLAACERSEDGLFIKELICPEAVEAKEAASALGFILGCRSCSFRAPAAEKHPKGSRAFGMLSKAFCDKPCYFGPAFD